MALRVRGNSTALNKTTAQVGKLASKSENPVSSRLVAKSFATKTEVTQRAALGNISNIARGTTAQNAKKATKKPTRPTRVTTKKSTCLSTVAQLPKQDVHNVKQDVKSPVPEAMELDHLGLTPKFLADIEDIDKDDFDCPQLCSEYVKEIYEYMHILELRYKVNKDYMEEQVITARMRTILVDWLIQVHLRFHLLQETLFLSIQLIDRYLSGNSVSRNKLQLVGVTAMFIASKYEEMYPPEISDFVYITDNAYRAEHIRATEQMMLCALDFNLGMPLCLHFLRRNSKACCVDPTMHTMAKYLMELTLPDYEFVQYDPSEIAAAALYMSVRLLSKDEPEWGEKMTYYSRYSEEHLEPIVQRLAKLVLKSETSKYQAVRNKYASSKFLKISTSDKLKPSSIEKLLNRD